VTSTTAQRKLSSKVAVVFEVKGLEYRLTAMHLQGTWPTAVIRSGVLTGNDNR